MYHLIFKFFILVSAICLSSGEFILYQHYDREFLINADDCVDQTCTDGARCSTNCSAVEVCINNQICPFQKCGDGSYCNRTYQCGAKDECPTEFECKDTGKFPDVYTECSKYYQCDAADATPIPHTCKEGRWYDPNVGDCTQKQCNVTAPDCDGKRCGITLFDPYMYYICMPNGEVFFNPLLLNCKSGSFNETTCVCNDDVPVSTNGTTKPETACSKPYFYYPVETDCHSYCLCQPSLTCKIERCIVGEYFDPISGRCVEGNC